MRFPRLLAALALTAAAACAHSGAPPPAAPPVPHAAPSAIVRAVKSPPWTREQLDALHAQLSAALAPSALPVSGIAIVDAAGRPLFVRHERRPMAPASTFKVVVATTALLTLGPGYRFETHFESIDAPHDGTLAGDLYLVGSGDPTLRGDDLRGGVGALVRGGTQHVSGNVIADATAFGGREINPAWDPDDLQYDYAAGTSALSLDEGTVELHVVPGTVGAPARVEVRPPNDDVRILGSILTGYTTLLSMDRAPARNDFTIDGHIAADAEQSFYRPVFDEPAYAAAAARTLLRLRGVTIDGATQTGVAPLSGTVLWSHHSAPLRVILRDMLFQSDNHYAEQLLRAVAAHEGAVGTEAAGAAVERGVFKRLGAPADGLRVIDGSGLAPTDRIAAISLATLLARAQLEPIGEDLFNALPRVGIEGTVRFRTITTALGRARAKSGHIENVNALTGYVDTRRHGRVAFAVIVNDPRADDGPVDDGIDTMLDILAGS
jgi:D-alanyl-D-alanine carboxypeptidase/D-alanyl-D-alanine-endopeptidase (penicillin-binding protein 4)